VSWAGPVAQRLGNEHLVLTPVAETDREALHRIAMDPLIWRHFVTLIETDDDYHAWFDASLADLAADRRIPFRISDRRTGTAVGSMSYGNLAAADRRLEIGWSWLGTPFQGRGYNSWAKLLLLEHAFDVLGAERVEFKTDVLNVQARRALRNIGAVEEGVFRSYNYMPGGRRRDAMFFSVIRADWPAVRDGLRAEAAPAGQP
jgi:RimJ/RimL family protein N-acetyltransferase